jgi:ABC-2 type transport system permease protein
MTALLALVRRDLRLFLADRRSLVVNVAVPIVLAALMGFVFGGQKKETSRIEVVVADLDGSPISRDLVAGLSADAALAVRPATPEEAREAVRKGKAAVGVILPAGFGEAAGDAFFGVAPKPELALLRDPSRGPEAGLVRGLLTQHVMQSVSSRLFAPESARAMAEKSLARLDQGGPGLPPGERRALGKLLEGVRDYYGAADAGGATPARQRGGLTVPFALAEEEVTAGRGIPYDGYAHSFAGMGVQFVLFLALDAAIALLDQRRRGLWDRVRAAPVSRATVLWAKAGSGAILAFAVLAAVLGAGMLAFGVRVRGSLPGFLLVLLATAAMASAFGLLVAALGRTPEATRGLAIFATLVMVMLGGAWFPAFLFPPWMQAATLAVPTRWAMDGLDGTLWRGFGLAEALGPTAALLGFAAAFGVLAWLRFRWSAE